MRELPPNPEQGEVKVGVPDLHLHDLLHTGNTIAADTGARWQHLLPEPRA